MASGYTQCDCTTCFDIAIGDDDDEVVLCTLCEEAGCDGQGECQREEELDGECATGT